MKKKARNMGKGVTRRLKNKWTRNQGKLEACRQNLKTWTLGNKESKKQID